jgi:hypothetical protein
MQLRITPIWMDEDSLMKVRVSLAGNGREAWGEAYSYPETFAEFGRALTKFPNSIADEVKLELGSADPGYAEHLMLRAFVYDGSGHCAVEIRTHSRGDVLTSSSCQFAVPTEAASMNDLGRIVIEWALKPEKAFVFDGAGA